MLTSVSEPKVVNTVYILTSLQSVDFEGSSTAKLKQVFREWLRRGNRQGREVTTTVQYCAAVTDIVA